MLTSGIPRTAEGRRFSWYALQLAARSKGETRSALMNTLYSKTSSALNLKRAILVSPCNIPPESRRLGPSSTIQGELLYLGFNRNLKSSDSEFNSVTTKSKWKPLQSHSHYRGPPERFCFCCCTTKSSSKNYVVVKRLKILISTP